MADTEPIREIAPARQTSLGLYVTAKEAYDMWQADPGLRILDVRTPEEFVFVGHAPMATNIPLALQTYEWDPEKKSLRWEMNPDFVAEVKAWAGPDDTILASCRSGGRSAMAINALAAAGFTRVYNILDGMEGQRGQGSRQRLRRDADEERLEELGAALDLRDRPRADEAAAAPEPDVRRGQRARLTAESRSGSREPDARAPDDSRLSFRRRDTWRSRSWPCSASKPASSSR